jgi:hypothetical protein
MAFLASNSTCCCQCHLAQPKCSSVHQPPVQYTIIQRPYTPQGQAQVQYELVPNPLNPNVFLPYPVSQPTQKPVNKPVPRVQFRPSIFECEIDEEDAPRPKIKPFKKKGSEEDLGACQQMLRLVHAHNSEDDMDDDRPASPKPKPVNNLKKEDAYLTKLKAVHKMFKLGRARTSREEDNRLNQRKVIGWLIDEYAQDCISIWDANLTMLKDYARQLGIKGFSTYTLKNADKLMHLVIKELDIDIRPVDCTMFKTKK